MKFLLLFSVFCYSALYASTLQVNITEIDISKGGNLIVAIFDSNESWPNIENARKVIYLDSIKSKLTVEFPDLVDSSYYAVEVIHDYNLNGKIDINLNPFKGSLGPTEGVGLSNDYRPSFAPKFNGAKFQYHKSSRIITIKLFYP